MSTYVSAAAAKKERERERAMKEEVCELWIHTTGDGRREGGCVFTFYLNYKDKVCI